MRWLLGLVLLLTGCSHRVCYTRVRVSCVQPVTGSVDVEILTLNDERNEP